MKHLVNKVTALILLFWWIAGVVMIKGGWLKALGVFFFPYSYYVVVEKILQLWEWQ